MDVIQELTKKKWTSYGEVENTDTSKNSYYPVAGDTFVFTGGEHDAVKPGLPTRFVTTEVKSEAYENTYLEKLQSTHFHAMGDLLIGTRQQITAHLWVINVISLGNDDADGPGQRVAQEGGSGPAGEYMAMTSVWSDGTLGRYICR